MQYIYRDDLSELPAMTGSDSGVKTKIYRQYKHTHEWLCEDYSMLTPKVSIKNEIVLCYS